MKKISSIYNCFTIVLILTIVSFTLATNTYAIKNELNFKQISTSSGFFAAMDAEKEARNYMAQGKLNEAINSFDKALELNSNWIPAYSGKALSLFGQGRCEESLFNLNEILRIEPNIETINPNIGFSTYYGKALNYQCLGEYNKAIESIDKALQIIPNDPDGEELRENLKIK